jgi:hypothetical protein
VAAWAAAWAQSASTSIDWISRIQAEHAPLNDYPWKSLGTRQADAPCTYRIQLAHLERSYCMECTGHRTARSQQNSQRQNLHLPKSFAPVLSANTLAQTYTYTDTDFIINNRSITVPTTKPDKVSLYAYAPVLTRHHSRSVYLKRACQQPQTQTAPMGST